MKTCIINYISVIKTVHDNILKKKMLPALQIIVLGCYTFSFKQKKERKGKEKYRKIAKKKGRKYKFKQMYIFLKRILQISLDVTSL